MSLRHALLALIEAGPATGYELAKRFDQSAAYVWNAQHSQIYTELRRLEAEGFVQAHTLPRGEKALATKRAYGLTLQGVAELQRWIADVEKPPKLKDPAYLKATYLEYGSLNQARAQFRAHRAHYERLRDHFEANADLLQNRGTPILQRRLDHVPSGAREAVVAFKVHAYRGLVTRARAEIAWADEGLEMLDRLSQTKTGLGHDAALSAPRPDPSLGSS